MLSIEYREAIAEVLDILQHSDDIVNRIPKNLIEFWQRNKSTTYKPNIDHSKPLNEMNLRSKTKSLITMIYLNFLCDENEKRKTEIVLEKNELLYRIDAYQQLLDEK